ncbi:MAG: phosphatidylserine decarboxylase [Clostridia bacterium]|nr:phosphatidylserine decarboxylase [Clostridia bacterium]
MKLLEILYNTIIGRCILKVVTRPWLSKIVGWYLDTPLSKHLIKNFVKKNSINLDEYCGDFKCFNDCFTRKLITPRKVEDGLVSPADSYLRAYEIKDLAFEVKHSYYSVSSLLRDEELAREYEGGLCLAFRLATNHYHRYIYPVSGVKEKNIKVKGRLHTVQPFGLEKYPVYVENTREYSVLHTEDFGDIVMAEVGALLVGKIDNYLEEGSFTKGEEKGKFLYGGSTIILLLKSGKVDEKYFKGEVEVKMGQKICEV